MFTLPDLLYPTNALEPHVDAQTMEIHHAKHHGTYVKNINDALASQPELSSLSVEQLISDLGRVPEEIRVKVRNNGGGHYNHTLFWQMMTPGGSPISPELEKALTTIYGSLDEFKLKFKEAGLSRFGSGWVWLTTDLKIVTTPNQDNPIMEGQEVILGLDVWEHAYYLKYQNKRADYIDAWWNIVNWKFVASRYAP